MSTNKLDEKTLDALERAFGGPMVTFTLAKDQDPDCWSPGDDLEILINESAPMITVVSGNVVTVPGSDSFSPACLAGLETEEDERSGTEIHDAQAEELARAICMLPELIRELRRLRGSKPPPVTAPLSLVLEDGTVWPNPYVDPRELDEPLATFHVNAVLGAYGHLAAHPAGVESCIGSLRNLRRAVRAWRAP